MLFSCLQTNDSYLLFYRLVDGGTDGKGLYEQKDSPVTSLRRDSAELFIKEVIPVLTLTLVSLLPVYFATITLSDF